METGTMVKGIVVVLAIGALVPFLPEIIDTVKGPDPALDAANLGRLQEAVENYTRDAGRYPRDLAVLAPNYIDSVPRTNSGKVFSYNSRTSQVGMPEEVTAKKNEGTGTGLSPFGESMTGLGIAGELNY